MGCILLRGVHVNDVNNICFYLHTQLLITDTCNRLSTHLRMAHKGRNMLWEEYNNKIQQLRMQVKTYIVYIIYINPIYLQSVIQLQ
jgi:hypothetical protein